MSAKRFVPVVTIASVVILTSACKDRQGPSNPAPKPIDVWAAEQQPSRRLALLLPVGQIQADILQVTAPSRLNELTTKLKKASQANPGPWLKQLLTAREGEPLPYDPSFGLTEEEYREFLSLSRNLVLKKVGEITLEMKSESDNVVTIKGFPGLVEVQFDTDRMSVKTPFGSVSEPRAFSPNENQKLTGPIQGFSWKSGVTDLLGGYTIQVLAAQQVDSRNVLMEVRVKDSVKGNYIVDCMVRYPGPSR